MADHAVTMLPLVRPLAGVLGAQHRVAYARPPAYAVSYADGERYGFSTEKGTDVTPIKPGETLDARKTVMIRLFGSTGLPASGLASEAPLCTPSASELQTSRNLAGYVNAAGTLTHVADNVYAYVASNGEVSQAGGEGVLLLRLRKEGYRTSTFHIPIRLEVVDVIGSAAAASVRDATLDALLADHAAAGSVADGIAIAAGLLQGNFFLDNTTFDLNGQTAGRVRLWRTAAAMSGATPGGVGQGEFAAFAVTTTYSAPGKVLAHKVTRL